MTYGTAKRAVSQRAVYRRTRLTGDFAVENATSRPERGTCKTTDLIAPIRPHHALTLLRPTGPHASPTFTRDMSFPPPGFQLFREWESESRQQQSEPISCCSSATRRNIRAASRPIYPLCSPYGTATGAGCGIWPPGTLLGLFCVLLVRTGACHKQPCPGVVSRSRACQHRQGPCRPRTHACRRI